MRVAETIPLIHFHCHSYFLDINWEIKGIIFNLWCKKGKNYFIITSLNFELSWSLEFTIWTTASVILEIFKNVIKNCNPINVVLLKYLSIIIFDVETSLPNWHYLIWKIWNSVKICEIIGFFLRFFFYFVSSLVYSCHFSKWNW